MRKRAKNTFLPEDMSLKSFQEVLVARTCNRRLNYWGRYETLYLTTFFAQAVYQPTKAATRGVLC